MGPKQDINQLNGRPQLPDAHIALPNILGKLVVPQSVLKPGLCADQGFWVDGLGFSPGFGRFGRLSPLQHAVAL